MAAKKVQYLFKIELINWDKYNSKSKHTFPYFMVSKTIFNDHKVAQMTPSEFQLMIFLFAVRSDSAANEFLINSKQVPNQLRMGDESLANGLHRLQSLQILTYEKIPLNKERSSRSNDISTTSENFNSTKDYDLIQKEGPKFTEFLNASGLHSLKKNLAKLIKFYQTVDNLRIDLNQIATAEKCPKKEIDPLGFNRYVCGSIVNTINSEGVA